MSEAKQAPGPWSLDKWGHIVDAAGEELRVYGVALTSTEQSKANTRLIAAAPDLLEALTEALAFTEANTFGGTDALALMDKARAAIAKATEAQ